jgi:5-methylcytosine-specific restriction protein A
MGRGEPPSNPTKPPRVAKSLAEGNRVYKAWVPVDFPEREGGFAMRAMQHRRAIADDIDPEPVAKKTRNPPWNREELLLALELYMRNRKSPPSKTSREVESLSKELNQLCARIGSRGSSSFRNPDGVYLKMMNFRSYDPDYTSQGKVGMRHGNKLDSVVWNEFFGKEAELFKACRAIREALKELPEDSDADSGHDGFAEADRHDSSIRLYSGDEGAFGEGESRNERRRTKAGASGAEK